jgi:cbb3-type cytochrome oxidase cytochrome c subunit
MEINEETEIKELIEKHKEQVDQTKQLEAELNQRRQNLIRIEGIIAFLQSKKKLNENKEKS